MNKLNNFMTKIIQNKHYIARQRGEYIKWST